MLSLPMKSFLVHPWPTWYGLGSRSLDVPRRSRRFMRGMKGRIGDRGSLRITFTFVLSSSSRSMCHRISSFAMTPSPDDAPKPPARAPTPPRLPSLSSRAPTALIDIRGTGAGEMSSRCKPHKHSKGCPGHDGEAWRPF